ncbi:DUF6207 family protein [Streptomyces sp. NPDC126497]
MRCTRRSPGLTVVNVAAADDQTAFAPGSVRVTAGDHHGGAHRTKCRPPD